MRPISFYAKREQSYIKHLFLEWYLNEVAFRIGYARGEFIYIDGFSGPWSATDEGFGDTSIGVALARLRYVLNALEASNRKRKRTRIKAVFVEKSKESFTLLQQALKEQQGPIETRALHGSFEDKISEVIAEAGDGFAFSFVDPTGWTGLSMGKLTPLLQRPNGEVMINFMSSFIKRFREDRGSEKSLNEFFGSENWRAVLAASYSDEDLVDLYVENVRRAGGFPFATCTRVLNPLKEQAHFYLVYATRHSKGIEKFREVERKVAAREAEIRHLTQRDHRVERTGQIELELGNPSEQHSRDERVTQLAKARERIEQMLKAGWVGYDDLWPQIAQLRLVCKADVAKIILEDVASAKLLVRGRRVGDRSPKPHWELSLNKSR